MLPAGGPLIVNHPNNADSARLRSGVVRVVSMRRTASSVSSGRIGHLSEPAWGIIVVL